MRITIDTIPHASQRYDTVGDWTFDGAGNLHITVSDMGNADYAFLVGIHEAIEAWLCRHEGIKEEDVTAFDEQFERDRAQGNVDEPGDDPHAPYNKEHFLATTIERLLAQALHIDWKEYGDAVNVL